MYAYEKYISKGNLRYVFYGIAAAFIVYFFWDSFGICQELSTNEIYYKQLPQNTQLIDNTYFPYTETMVDLEITVGGQLWKLFINITQIIFLVMFMLMLYVIELNENGTKNT